MLKSLGINLIVAGGDVENESLFDYSVGVIVGTAAVGDSPMNGYCLCDLHGNVAELCLDIFAEPESGSIDPCGAITGTRRVYKGGSWKHAANQIVSGNRHKGDVRVDYIFRNVGFRLCLQGAEIPVSERTIELYVRKRVDPSTGNEVAAGVDNFVGFVGWVSGGETNMIPVVSGAGSKSVSRLMSASPMAAKRLNTALAVGVALDNGSNPYCRLIEFSVEGDILKGKVEVGADTAGRESVGAIGKNAVVVLLGAAGLNDDFSEVGKIDVASDGSFTMTKPSKCNFFKLRIDVLTVVE